MTQAMEILKNKAFYWAMSMLFLSVILVDDIRIGLLFALVYLFFKAMDYKTVRAIIVGIF